MAQIAGLNRRSFLRSAGLTALAGAAVGTRAANAAEPTAPDFYNASTGKFDFDTPYSRIGTDSTKWDQQIRTYGTDLIAGMGIADMDFRAAPSITQALMERIQHENWGYLDQPKSFVEGLVAWNKRRYGLTVNPESVVLTTGVHPGLIAALRAFCPPGSKVLLQTPTYNGFYGDLRASNTIPEESPLKLVNGRYSMDFEDLERRISRDTHALILCNPQNPTGNVWSQEDMMRLGEICTRRRVLVLADEIHCDFVTKGHKYTPYASLPNRDIVMNSITFKAASKSFSLAAMKCAWFFSDNPELVARTRAQNRADLTTLGMIASKAAYAGGEQWLNQVVDYIDGNHEFVAKYVKEHIPLVKTVKPEGTYLSWLDVSGIAERINAKAESDATKSSARPLTPEQVVERWLVAKAKVHMNQGASYGLGGGNHMRMNIATSRQTLEAALNSMAKATKTL
jgi:cystathionine beta-lyase